MKHIDGIGVSITTPCGSPFLEWPNPFEKRHPDFDGSLGSRQVVVPPGTRFIINVEFDASFKLYRATGVAIIIEIGDASSRLSCDDNSQVFYLDARKMDIRKKHRFELFAFWEREGEIEPSEYLPLEMPRPNPAYSTASATWLDNSEWYEASTGCVAVWVIRGKLNEDEDDPDYKRGRPTDSPGTTSDNRLLPYRGRYTTYDPNAKDDDEELPRHRRSGCQVEKHAATQPSRLRQTTLHDLGVKSALRTRGISKSPPGNSGTLNTQRVANRNASSPFPTATGNAYAFPLPTPPSEHQQRRRHSRRDVVDLTVEPEEKPVIIKRETVDTIPLNESSQATVTTPAVDDEDSEDLEDELRQIEIRRKLRAKKKKKRPAGQTAF